MASRAVRDWYEALRSLERRAAKARPGYSRRTTAKALARVSLSGQRISDWLPDDVDKAHIPRFSDPAIEEMVWALIGLWSAWAGDPRPDRSYWMELLEAAQPVRARPPESDRPAAPAQLPVVPADFVGRTRELDEVGALCSPSGPGPVVVFGVGGVGKSALASRLAHDLAGSYPDGQLFSRLREDDGPLEGGPVLARFLRALGVPAADVPDDLASQSALYRTSLAGRRMLILLDGATSEAQVRPLLPATDGCLVLVTSRNPLPALEGAATYRLDLLDHGEAEGLLARIAGPDRAEAGEEAVREVVDLCGRLPLAIRIAAARLRARTDWTPAHLARLLTDTRRRLRELHAGDLDVRAALELSYRDLDDDAARLFRLLAVRPGPTFSAELAAELSGRPVPDVEALLDGLILDQLVEISGTPGCYWMHGLIWLLAIDLLREGDEEAAALNSMGTWYAQKLGQVLGALRFAGVAPDRLGGPSPLAPAEALSWLDDEEENVILLLAMFNDAGHYILTAGMAYPIAVIARQRGLRTVRAWALDTGLAAAGRGGDPGRKALLLFEHGEFLAEDDSWADALASWSEALTLVDPAEGPGLAASLHGRLAYAYQGLGRLADAERESAAAAEAVAALDPRLSNLVAVGHQVQESLDTGQVAKALGLLEPLGPAMEHLPPEPEVAHRLQLGQIYNDLRRYPEAVRQLVRCRQVCRHYGVRSLESQVLLALGKAYRGRGWHDRAREVWEEGLSATERTADHGMTARLAYELADHWQRNGDGGVAAELFTRSAEAFENAGQHCNQAGALNRLALVLLDSGDRDGADDAWARAMTGLDHAGNQAQAEANRRQIRKARAHFLG